jgi:hypothetical protein
LFVVAAGNRRPSLDKVASPGSAPSALTVGAVDRDDTLAGFSLIGPTISDGSVKPDVTAPGVEIVAALSGSAKPTSGVTPFEQGAGRVDVARALNQTVVSEPTSLNFGTVAWPHDDNEPVTGVGEVPAHHGVGQPRALRPDHLRQCRVDVPFVPSGLAEDGTAPAGKSYVVPLKFQDETGAYTLK